LNLLFTELSGQIIDTLDCVFSTGLIFCIEVDNSQFKLKRHSRRSKIGKLTT